MNTSLRTMVVGLLSASAVRAHEYTRVEVTEATHAQAIVSKLFRESADDPSILVTYAGVVEYTLEGCQPGEERDRHGLFCDSLGIRRIELLLPLSDGATGPHDWIDSPPESGASGRVTVLKGATAIAAPASIANDDPGQRPLWAVDGASVDIHVYDEVTTTNPPHVIRKKKLTLHLWLAARGGNVRLLRVSYQASVLGQFVGRPTK